MCVLILPLCGHTVSPTTTTYTLQGIACNLDSVGFQRLDEATRDVMGESKPYSICGSLPLVGDLQRAGFDVQVLSGTLYSGHPEIRTPDNQDSLGCPKYPICIYDNP